MELGHLHGRITPKGRTSTPTLPGVDVAGGGFRAGAAGSKRYGSGQIMPNLGRNTNLTGYLKRDNQLRARREALARSSNGALLRGTQ